MIGQWIVLPDVEFLQRLEKDHAFRVSPAVQSALAFPGDLVRFLLRGQLAKGELPMYLQPSAQLFNGSDTTLQLLAALKNARRVDLTFGSVSEDAVHIVMKFTLDDERASKLRELRMHFVANGSTLVTSIRSAA